jgi:hypothetical protein
LKESGLSIPEYYNRNNMFGSPQLFPREEEYELLKRVWLKDERGFEVLYVGCDVPGTP